MKVLWFANTPCNADEYFNKDLRGTGGWLKALDQSLQENVDLHIAFHYGHKNIQAFNYKKTSYHPIQIYKNRLYNYWVQMTNKVFDQEFKDQYLKITKDVNPDIIHIHGTENPYGCIIGVTNIPIVISIQGNLTVYSHKFCTGFDHKYLSVSKREKILFKKSFKSGYIRQIKMAQIEQKNLLNCKNIIGRTKWDYRITRLLAPDSYYYHVDEILRDEFYQNIWQKSVENKFVVMTTNGNNFYKGFETICESISLLNNIGLNFEWRIAGIKEDDLIVKIVKKKLKTKYPKQGLKLLGSLSSSKLIKNLLDSNVYVMPSHIENSPNNLCEAMILGMPCIATYAGGTGSLLEDGKEGILIQDGDPWVMAGAILGMENNYEKAIKMGRKAREKALKRHDVSKVVNDLINIYQNIINEK